jgi:hypothetical protein
VCVYVCVRVRVRLRARVRACVCVRVKYVAFVTMTMFSHFKSLSRHFPVSIYQYKQVCYAVA